MIRFKKIRWLRKTTSIDPNNPKNYPTIRTAGQPVDRYVTTSEPHVTIPISLTLLPLHWRPENLELPVTLCYYLINHFFLTVLSFLSLTTAICFLKKKIYYYPFHFSHAHTLFHLILALFDLGFLNFNFHCQIFWARTCAWFLLKSQKCWATVFFMAKKPVLVICLFCRILVLD